MDAKVDPAMPNYVPWLVRWFQRYSRKYAAKHFHAVRLAKGSAAIPKEDGEPLLFVTNHPSWWDVITAFIISSTIPEYRHYAPMDSVMLKKYGIFKRLGLFGVEQTPRGAAIFIRTVKAIFTNSHHALWVTAQGRFADARERPIDLRPGIGAAASRLTTGWVIPIAMEYPFWNERTPELLIRIGQPICIADHPYESQRWLELITHRLTETMDSLASDSISRDASRFEDLIKGRVGVGGVYDWWRSLVARLRGKKVDLGHSEHQPSREDSVVS